MEEFDIPREERRRDYELTMILSAAPENEKREGVVEHFRSIIANEGAELIEIGTPKQQQLVYPIRKERQGVFYVFTFRGSSHLPLKIMEAFRHNPLLLRHMVTERQKIRPRARKPAPSYTPTQTQDASQRMDEQIEAALKNPET